MATLMTYGTNDTRRRCDATCHNAKHSTCRCICGGRFHGSSHTPGGVDESVRQYGHEVCDAIERDAKDKGEDVDTTVLRERIDAVAAGEKP